MFNRFNFGAVFGLTLAVCVLAMMPGKARACACCGTFQVVGVAADDVLNIRSGPGVRYHKVGAIPAGSACVIKTGRRWRQWAEVLYGPDRGWVNAHYLRFMATPQSSPR